MLDAVARSFSRGAQNYNRCAQVQHQVVDKLVSLVHENIVGAKSILDLGCGTGRLLEHCHAISPYASLTGLDISSQMLAQVKLRDAPIECVESAIESSGLESGQYDLVISSSALQWTQLELAINEAHRLCAPDGAVAISWFSSGTLSSWRQLWGGTHQALSDSAQMIGVLQAANFNLIEAQTHCYEEQMTSFEEAIRSVKGIGAGAGANGSRAISKATYMDKKNQFSEVVQKKGFFSMEYRSEFMLLEKVMSVS